jgi:hypothetical protein
MRRAEHGHCAIVKLGDFIRRETPEYRTWLNMRQRCSNPNANNYKNWGGRGICVCDRWNDSFAAFLADVGERPTEVHSLDRIDVNGNYEPGNVRWALPKEQAKNKRAKWKHRRAEHDCGGY